MSIHVLLKISPADAVRAFSPHSGFIEVSLTKEMLEQFTDEQQEALVNCGALNTLAAMGDQYNSLPGASTPDLKGIKTALNRYIEDRQAEKAEREKEEAIKKEDIKAKLAELQAMPTDALIRKHSWNGQWELGAIWHHSLNGTQNKYIEEFASERKRANDEITARNALLEEENKRLEIEQARINKEREEKEKIAEEKRKEQRHLYLAALDAFVAQHGDANQRERQDHKVLPRKEAEALVRNYFFSVFEGCAAYEKIKATEVLAAADCEYPQEDLVSFEVEGKYSFTAEQWDALKAFKARAENSNVDMSFKTQKHCGMYDDETVVFRYSVKVSFTWHGEEFHKTYAL